MKVKIKPWQFIPKARTRGIIMIMLPGKYKGLRRIRSSRKTFQVTNASLVTRWDTSP